MVDKHGKNRYDKGMQHLSNCPQETFNIGKSLAQTLQAGSVVLLSGYLGAGKTVFSKGIASGLGILDEVTSPTFTLMCNYEVGDVSLCHIDAYRVKSALEAEEAGLAEVIGASDTITLIEWHENIAALLTNLNATHVTIQAIDENIRQITIV